jgi:hypothetical protein
MNEDNIILRFREYAPIWVPLLAGLASAIIANFKGRPFIWWYLYGLACTVVFWPLLIIPTIHAFLLRPRIASPQKVPLEQRRAQALALFGSSQSYPSWIDEFRRKSAAGIDRRRYAHDHLGSGEAIELIRKPAKWRDGRAVAYYHHDVHLGYIPKQHGWVADAIDDGHRVIAVVETIKFGRLLRRRARFVNTRIMVIERSE